MRTDTQRRKAQQTHSRASMPLHWPDTLPVACRLDRLADAELQQGHIARAEHLAWQAQQMREAMR